MTVKAIAHNLSQNPILSSSSVVCFLVELALNEKMPTHWAYLKKINKAPSITRDLIEGILDYQNMLTSIAWRSIEEEGLEVKSCPVSAYESLLDAVIGYYGG